MSMHVAKRFEEYDMSDDLIFKWVMEDADICRRFLELVSGEAVENVRFLQTEKEMRASKWSKGISVDVLVMDEGGRAFSLDMQTRRPVNFVQRSLYYQAMLRITALQRGGDYKAVVSSCVIFVCTFDAIREGLSRYSYRCQCDQIPGCTFGSQWTIIFLDTNGDGDDVSAELAEVLAFIGHSDTAKGAQSTFGLVRDMSRKLDMIRSDDIRREEHMEYELKMRDVFEDGKEEGREEGERSMALRIARSMLANGFPPSQISQITCLPIDEVAALRPETAEDARGLSN